MSPDPKELKTVRRVVRNFLLEIALLTWFLCLVVFLWAAFWPFRTLVITNYNDKVGLTMPKTQLYPGDPIRYYISFCKYSTSPVDVHFSLADGQTAAITTVLRGSLPKGCYSNVLVTPVNVPDTANPGLYRLFIESDYHPTLLQTIPVQYHTQEFTVLARPQMETITVLGHTYNALVTQATTTTQK